LHEGRFTADDGTALAYRHWPGACARALIVFPWGDARRPLSEEAAEGLGAGDCHVFAWEARGKTEAGMTAVRDAERFARHVQALHGIALADMAVIGRGLGGALAAAWAHDYAPPLRALILVDPTLNASPLPRTMRRRLIADAAAVAAPTQLWVRVGATRAQALFFARLGSRVKERHDIRASDGALDEIVVEARRFVADAFSQPPTGADPGEADRRGPWRAEYDANAGPMPVFSPRHWGYAATGLAMRSIGRLSRGISLGLSAGFDSGPMFDYVYRDRAQGISPLGRKIDRDFLDKPSWRAVRARRHHLAALLARAIATLRGAGGPIHVVEIGAGGARYTLEILRKHAPEATALMLDNDPRSVTAAAALADEAGTIGVASKLGDGFDRAGLAGLDPRPTIVIVSGLYEQRAENAPLRESLAGLAAAMQDGSFLLYTNLPWNPELAFIARVLTTREGRRWVMRRRSQAEMDALVGEAGFEKLAMAIDDDGIITVSLARRRGRAGAVPSPRLAASAV
jgi:pimeloyl-ACP methyl ester carboxylesterase